MLTNHWTYIFFLSIWLCFGLAIDNNPVLDVEDEECNDLAKYIPAIKKQCTVLSVRNDILNEPLGSYYLDAICFYVRNGKFPLFFDVDITASTFPEKSGKEYFLSIFENIKTSTNNFTEYYNDLCPSGRNLRLSAVTANDASERLNYNLDDLSQIREYYRAILLNEARRLLTQTREVDVNREDDKKPEVTPFSLLPARTPLPQYIHDRSRVLPDMALKYNDLKAKILLAHRRRMPLPTISVLPNSQLGNVEKKDKSELVRAIGLQSNYHSLIPGSSSGNQFPDLLSKINPTGPSQSNSRDNLPSFGGLGTELENNPLNPSLLPHFKTSLGSINRGVQAEPSVLYNSKIPNPSLFVTPVHTSSLLPRVISFPKILRRNFPRRPSIFEKYPHLREILRRIPSSSILPDNHNPTRLPVAFGLNANMESPNENKNKIAEDKVISSDVTKLLSNSEDLNNKEKIALNEDNNIALDVTTLSSDIDILNNSEDKIKLIENEVTPSDLTKLSDLKISDNVEDIIKLIEEDTVSLNITQSPLDSKIPTNKEDIDKNLELLIENEVNENLGKLEENDSMDDGSLTTEKS